MSLSTKLKKKIKKKIKKQRQAKNKATRTDSKRPKSRDNDINTPLSKLATDPNSLSDQERQAAIQGLKDDIETAKKLPPDQARPITSLAQFLKQVLLNLDPKGQQNKDESEDDKQSSSDTETADISPADIQKAQRDLAAAKAAVGSAANAAHASPLAAAPALKKKPEDMDASDIKAGIDAVEAAIKDSKALLPADASLLQRALFALKMALFELGNVDPKLAVKNKDDLESLISDKAAAKADPATQANVTQAIDTVNSTMAQVASRRPPENATTGRPEYPGLDSLRQKDPTQLSPAEVQAALADIDRLIQSGTTLLPKTASPLLRALYILKNALLELGNVDPQLRYDIQEQLDAVLTNTLDL